MELLTITFIIMLFMAAFTFMCSEDYYLSVTGGLGVIFIPIITLFIILFVCIIPPDNFSYYDNHPIYQGTYLKPPWYNPTLYPADYTSIEIANIPFTTSDNYNLLLSVSYPSYKYNSYELLHNYNGNISTFKHDLYSKLQPKVQSFYGKYTGSNLYFDGNSINEAFEHQISDYTTEISYPTISINPSYKAESIIISIYITPNNDYQRLTDNNIAQEFPQYAKYLNEPSSDIEPIYNLSNPSPGNPLHDDGYGTYYVEPIYTETPESDIYYPPDTHQYEDDGTLIIEDPDTFDKVENYK